MTGNLGAARAEVSSGALASAAGIVSLAVLPVGALARVVSVTSDAGGQSDLGRRLAELGFLPGERLRIVARGMMGREPIAIRIGTSTFALRRFEAECVQVSVEQPLRG